MTGRAATTASAACRGREDVAGARGGDGVVPELAELIALRSLALARGMARRGSSGSRGQAPAMSRGRGMEYAESRAYALGDDARHVDWRLTARSGKPHTKLYQAERERLTLVVVDTSPVLYFGTRVRFKSVQAARAGAVAAWRAVADGDRVAALRGSTRAAPVPAASGSKGALRVLDALARWYARPPDEDAGLALALDQARRLLRPGSRLLVLADPGSVASIPAARWPTLAAHHEVMVLLLTDPLEMTPPEATLAFAPSLQAAGSGTAGRLELDLAATGPRTRWRAEFADRVAATRAALAARGVRALPLSSDAPSDAWLWAPRPGGR